MKKKVGKMERLILGFLKEQKMSTSALSIVLRAEGRIKNSSSVRRAIHRLRGKGLIDRENKLTEVARKKYIDLAIPPPIAHTFDLHALGGLRLGAREKILLYILSRIDHGSLQFLANLVGEPLKNTSAVMTRMESKHLVYGYRSMMTFSDAKGRRYRPKYYRITDLGRILSAASRSDIQGISRTIDQTLDGTFRFKDRMAHLYSKDPICQE